MTARPGDPDFPYMMENTPEEFDRVIGKTRPYDQGGAIRPGLTMAHNSTGVAETVVKSIRLSRGTVVMSQASLDALGPDLLRRLTGDDVDIVSAEDALAELDDEDES